ncbi:MAG: hypothetical protein LUI87_05115 [Lachnospiraceae bacterium]|nr:hypothetical protein [Lachnospiraceae bacterium]
MREEDNETHWLPWRGKEEDIETALTAPVRESGETVMKKAEYYTTIEFR